MYLTKRSHCDKLTNGSVNRLVVLSILKLFAMIRGQFAVLSVSWRLTSFFLWVKITLRLHLSNAWD